MTLAALGFAVACASTDSERRSVPPIEDGSVQVLSEADTLLINDPLGSLLAETSGTGTVQARFATYPFGKTRFSTSSETELYTGAARDRGVELDLMGARSYAPDLGIWTIGDPIVVTSPESLVDSVFAVANPYAYAALTPLVAVDPDGNHPAVVMAMGALAGASASSGIEVIGQLIDKGRVTQPGRVYAAAAGGAVAGAFTGGLGGVVRGATARVALGASAGVAQVATTEVVRTKGRSTGTPRQLATGAVTGGAMVGLSVTVMRGATAPKPSFSGCNQLMCWGKGTWKVKKGAGDVAPRGGPNLHKWNHPTATKAAGWKEGDHFFVLPDKGTPKANWAQNAGRMRSEMGKGKPIFDSFRDSNGQLMPTTGFLNAERKLLQSRDWSYNPSTGAWHPPAGN